MFSWYTGSTSRRIVRCESSEYGTCVNVPQGKEKIAAVVVTYNRKDLLGQCIDSLLAQTHALDAIYVIDNHSADGTHDYLLGRNLIAPNVAQPLSAGGSQESPPGAGVPHVEHLEGEPVETARSVPVPGFPRPGLEVHYVGMPENTGGAGGFHEGMKRAAAGGFDWLWLMDDDLLTAPDALEVLVQKKTALEGLGHESFLLNSLVLIRDQPDSDRLVFPLQELSAKGYPRRGIYHWRLSEVRDQVKNGLYRWACPFNGTFIPARAVTEIGLPNREFFIWGDEKDFLWRAAKRFNLYTAVDSKVFHPPRRGIPFDWRQYYGIRNMIFVNRHFSFTALRNLKLILLSLAKGVRHGPSGLALVLRAIRDGLTGRLGKRDDLHR